MQLFPRHVIMDLGMGGEVTVEKIARLARAHDGVSVLFMGAHRVWGLVPGRALACCDFEILHMALSHASLRPPIKTHSDLAGFTFDF